jgi:hypothetical protein
LFLTEGKGATAGLWFWESRARETVKAGVQGKKWPREGSYQWEDGRSQNGGRLFFEKMKGWFFSLAERQCPFAGERGGLWRWFWVKRKKKSGAPGLKVVDENKMGSQSWLRGALVFSKWRGGREMGSL